MAISKDAEKVETPESTGQPKERNWKDFARENWALIAAIIYVISPLDFLPDVLPALGFVDDLGVLVVSLVHKYIMYKKR